MQIRAEPAAPHQAVLYVGGDIDMKTSAELQSAGSAALAQGGVLTLTLDLAEVTFLDSAGVSALVAIFNEGRERGAQVMLRAVRVREMRILEMTGLVKVFTIEP